MKLIEVISGTKTKDPLVLDLVIKVEDDYQNTLQIAYSHNIKNPKPIQDQVATWLSDHELVLTEYAPPNAEAYELELARTLARSEMIKMCDNLTRETINYYPQAEVESWNIQKAEAETFLNANTKDINLAPFLLSVCVAEFGPADNTTRLSQVDLKAQTVKANAQAWGMIAAYVNGLRSRVQDSIKFAENENELRSILDTTQAEINQFAATYMS